MRQILTIWKKELKDTLRDRRAVMSMIIMPLLVMPLLLIGIAKLSEYQSKKLSEQVVKVSVLNAQNSELEQFIKSQEKIEIVETQKSIKDSIKDGDVNIAIEIPQNVDVQITQSQPVSLSIHHDSTDSSSNNALDKLSAVLTQFNDQIVSERFTTGGINQQILSKIDVAPQDVASEQERGGFGLGLILPMFIVIWSIAGGQYTAVDVSAGEKERKTLESLLLTPASRLEIVLGKFFAVSTTALVSVVMSLASFYVAFAFGFSGAGGGELSFSVQPLTILLLFAVSLLLVLMFSAIQLSIGIFAKSFKEAQSYIGPAYLIVILPIAILNTLPNFNPETWFYLLPVVNALTLFKELLLGVFDPVHILVTFGSLIVYSAIAIYVTVRIYNQEDVLFSS